MEMHQNTMIHHARCVALFNALIVENNLSTGWAIKTMLTHPGSQIEAGTYIFSPWRHLYTYKCLHGLKMYVYFFAHDMLNYARMMPVYLSDMKLKDSKSTVYAEFLQGNWVVNKNPLPF